MMDKSRQKNLSSFGKTFSFIKSVWFITSLCICIYIIGQRIVHFFNNPLTTYTETAERNSVQFPVVLFCRYGFTRYIQSVFLDEVKARCKLENDCRNLPLDDIKQYPLEKLNFSVEKYWDKYGIGTNMISNLAYCKYMTHPTHDCKGEHAIAANVTTKRTSLGTCVEHYLGAEFNYFGYYTFLTINIKAPITFFKNSSVYIEDVWLYLPSNNDYSLHDVFYGVRTIPKEVQVEAILSTQSYHLISTKENPCTHSSHTDCINQCFNELLRTNLTCNLPFFSVFGFPTCDTYTDAINMYSKLYNVYESIAINHCQCHKMCEHTSVKGLVTLEKKTLNDPNYSTSVSFRFATDAIFTTSHQYAYPFSALISDIGGNIGFFLGVSMFTSYDILKGFFILLLQKIKNKDCIQENTLTNTKIKPNSIVSKQTCPPRRRHNYNYIKKPSFYRQNSVASS